MLLLFLSCTTQDPITAEANSTQSTVSQKPFQNFDKGQKHPPLPENNPIWDWDAKDFVPDFGWFGEHSWMDVRMRVAGHLSAAGRDKARIYATKEDWSAAAKAYAELGVILAEIPTASSGTSKEINALLALAAKRDAKTLNSIATQSDFSKAKGTLYPLRLQYFALARKHANSIDVRKEAQTLIESLNALPTSYPKLDISSFKDFHSRHALRIRLFEAYLDALDPLTISERWGYWTADEIIRQQQSLILACKQLLKSPSDEYQKATGNPILWPSQYLSQKTQDLDSSTEEFGALPTGDSLIDIGSSPGPKGIGDLMKWGLADKEHMQWLSKAAHDITSPLPDDPQKSMQAYRKHIPFLEKAKHGSRFYNVKQLRNATVRQLARSGHFMEAHEVLQDNFPLHNQDWACPNREGILLAIDGRLLALAEDPSAEIILDKAIESGTTFLQHVDEAEQGKRKTPVPPVLKGMKPAHPPKNTGNHSHKNHKGPKPPKR
ncbi:MAG: hypothetical protein CL916_07975 [Deltaproteobacteria bacterium]|nr:hypothetical protein [Deltaproteobacteria bacterium]